MQKCDVIIFFLEPQLFKNTEKLNSVVLHYKNKKTICQKYNDPPQASILNSKFLTVDNSKDICVYVDVVNQ